MTCLPFLIIEQEDEGRNRKQIEKMYADGKPDKEGYEDNPAVGIW